MTEEFCRKLAEEIVENMRVRRMEAYYCESKEDALKKALELIPEGASVGWGGSQSVKEIGLMDAILNGSYEILDRNCYSDFDEKMEMYAKILRADWFLMSSNAISRTGELVNIDGRSDRIAFLCFGPQNVLIIAGMNKVAVDLESAVKRAQQIAGPQNAIKLKRNTPCLSDGKCTDCLAEDSVCSQILITRRSAYKNRIKVILVGEELGF